MRAIFIDATARTVGEIEIDGSLDSLQKPVGGYIESATNWPNGDTLYVNEEGLLNGTTAFFDIGAHQPFAGNGIIAGNDDEGETVAAKTPLLEVVNKVKFMTINEVRLSVRKDG